MLQMIRGHTAMIEDRVAIRCEFQTTTTKNTHTATEDGQMSNPSISTYYVTVCSKCSKNLIFKISIFKVEISQRSMTIGN